MCGELQFSMYGTRDAALNWAEAYGSHLMELGFEKGMASPCLCWHPTKTLKTLVLGDDYVLFRLAGISQDAAKSPLRCLLWVKGRAFGTFRLFF